MDHKLELRNLLVQVKEMRKAQAVYFNNRKSIYSYSLLDKARAKEKLVDEMIKDMEVRMVQKNLF